MKTVHFLASPEESVGIVFTKATQREIVLRAERTNLWAQKHGCSCMRVRKSEIH